MKTEILKVKGDWQEVVNDCRSTVGKEDLGHEPSTEFKTKILISEHSPIRSISIKWKWELIKSWIATHFSRHKWECFIRTQRSDRTGFNRDDLSQGSEVSFTGEANVQALIDTMRKRLCYQASLETREYAEDLKIAIHKVQPEIADVLVPNCVYRCGCCELNCCGFFDKIVSTFEEDEDIIGLHPNLKGHYEDVESLFDIKERYFIYNKIFMERKKDKNNV